MLRRPLLRLGQIGLQVKPNLIAKRNLSVLPSMSVKPGLFEEGTPTEVKEAKVSDSVGEEVVRVALDVF